MSILLNLLTSIRGIPDRFRSPLLEEDKGGENRRLRLEFKKGRLRGKRYIVEYQMCPDPTCPCRVIQVYFCPFTDDQKHKSETLYSFGIDICKREISNDDDDIETEDEENFAANLIDSLTEKDWDLLRQLFFNYKAYMTETADPQEIDAVFHEEIMEDPSMMVGYEEILPYGGQVHLDIEGRHYAVDDQYCVNPDCGCNEVALTFISMGRKLKKSEVHATVLFNYEKSSWKELEETKVEQHSSTNVTRTSVLMKGLLAQFPISTWTTRHEKLRILYRRYRMRYLSTAGIPHGEKIGRNAPCPCGSGKKYKKCCMGKALH